MLSEGFRTLYGSIAETDEVCCEKFSPFWLFSLTAYPIELLTIAWYRLY